MLCVASVQNVPKSRKPRESKGKGPTRRLIFCGGSGGIIDKKILICTKLCVFIIFQFDNVTIF